MLQSGIQVLWTSGRKSARGRKVRIYTWNTVSMVCVCATVCPQIQDTAGQLCQTPYSHILPQNREEIPATLFTVWQSHQRGLLWTLSLTNSSERKQESNSIGGRFFFQRCAFLCKHKMSISEEVCWWGFTRAYSLSNYEMDSEVALWWNLYHLIFTVVYHNLILLPARWTWDQRFLSFSFIIALVGCGVKSLCTRVAKQTGSNWCQKNSSLYTEPKLILRVSNYRVWNGCGFNLWLGLSSILFILNSAHMFACKLYTK